MKDRYCTGCKQTKPATEFHRLAFNRCKECKLAYQKEYRLKNPHPKRRTTGTTEL